MIRTGYSLLTILISFAFLSACSPVPKTVPARNHPGIKLQDSSLELELIAEQPDIMTPIGMAIDENDNIYILESHTHTPPSDYEGPEFDKIKKGVDEDGDGRPERWTIFADSIEDGMNLIIVEDTGLYLATKNKVILFSDTDGDGKSDQRQELLKMVKPDYVYDHAGILGLTISQDNWLYISRGNTGGRHWEIVGVDQSTITGYGDGGNVFRCKMDGSELEEVATGFWNPFDLKFRSDGRLLLTDNDPDSRGPNRLIEIVPGGDYGYRSLYGGSGIHPFLAWNGELPGTLPYAAPLGEAPCALIDAAYTNFGDAYGDQVLVNVWEENNIVRITLQPNGSTVTGKPQTLLQGDSLFHPVALATNKNGDLYITDWVIRQYPNHGHGKIWRLRSKAHQPIVNHPTKIDRFEPTKATFDELIQILQTGDVFEQAIARSQLAKTAEYQKLSPLIKSDDPTLRLQALLIFLAREEQLDKSSLQSLLEDKAPDLNKMALVYIGRKRRQDMDLILQSALKNGQIKPSLFETYLATIRHIQPDFIKKYNEKSELNSKDLPRVLPDFFILNILKNKHLDEATKAIALPYLEKRDEHQAILLDLFRNAEETSFQLALLHAMRQHPKPELALLLLSLLHDPEYSDQVKAMALSLLSLQAESYCTEVLALLESNSELVQFAAVKYLCRCTNGASVKKAVDQWISKANPDFKDSWDFCNGKKPDNLSTPADWIASVNNQGNIERGQLVFETLQAQCIICHKVNGWGGTFGPDLSNIGSSKTPLQLINAILDPSLEIAPEWQGWYVTDQRGKTHFGRQIDVHLDHVELMNTTGSFDRFDEPKSYGVADHSLMPEGLQNTMTPMEFNDLIAYLKSLK